MTPDDVPAPHAIPSHPVAPTNQQPTTPEEWEQVRRSVAMLPPGAWAMRREQSLHALAELLATLRKTPKR